MLNVSGREGTTIVTSELHRLFHVYTVYPSTSGSRQVDDNTVFNTGQTSATEKHPLSLEESNDLLKDGVHVE